MVEVTGENTALNCSTSSNDFVGVDALMGFFAEDFFCFFLSAGHSCHTADEDDFVDTGLGNSGVAETVFAGFDSAFDQTIAESFQFSSGKSLLKVERTGLVHGDEGQVDFTAHAGGKFTLCLFSSFFQSLKSLRIFLQVNTIFFQEAVCQPVNDDCVKVVTAEVGVSICSFHFEHAVSDFENGDIECTAAKVIDCNGFFFLIFVDTVSKSCGGGFVDDTFDVKTCDSTGVFSCLSLAVVEVSRDGDDSFGDFFTEICFSIIFELLQDHCGDFRRRVFLAVNFNASIAVGCFGDGVRNAFCFFLHIRIFHTHQTFNGENCIFRVCDSLTFCSLTNQTFTIFCECNDRGSCVCSFCVRNDFERSVIHHSHAAVCGSQVNTKNSSHSITPFCWLLSVYENLHCIY